MKVNSTIHAKNGITNLRDEIEIMGDHENRHFLFQLGQSFDELLLHREINIRGRLIEKEEARFAGESSRNQHSLSLSS